MKMDAKRRAVDKIFKRRHRYEIPDYQREKVWGPENKRKLIDSMLRGWKLPKFYLLKTGSSEYEVVDGQQRLETIFEFLEGDLELSEDAAAEFGGSTYDELDEEVSDDFDDYEIEYDEISEADEDEIQEFFQRLQMGYRLTSSERLNAIPGKLTSFCRSLRKHDFFTNKVLVKNKRYAHFDIAAKATAIEIEGLDAGLRIDDLSELFRANRNFSAGSKNGKRLKAALDFLDKALDDESPILRTRSLTQSIITLGCRLVEHNVGSNQQKTFNDFAKHFSAELVRQVELGHEATDEDYLAFQKTVNANVRSAARTRHQILLRKLFQFDPLFAESFDSLAITDSGTDTAIDKMGADLMSIVSDINDIYSASNGKDLFKASNKTSKAQAMIRKPSKDYDGYKGLIENLYFLFWEGPGARLPDKPASFVAINDLRTGLQHDVDHGKAGKIAAKKKGIGATFEKYAGVASPAAAAPERFPVVHLKLLTDLKADLRRLKNTLAEGD